MFYNLGSTIIFTHVAYGVCGREWAVREDHGASTWERKANCSVKLSVWGTNSWPYYMCHLEGLAPSNQIIRKLEWTSNYESFWTDICVTCSCDVIDTPYACSQWWLAQAHPTMFSFINMITIPELPLTTQPPPSPVTATVPVSTTGGSVFCECNWVVYS